MIIGVTSLIGGGKDSVGDYLKNKDFTKLSLSDEIREEARKRSIELTRENLIALANEMRATEGLGVLAKRVVKKIEQGKNYVVESIRNPEEVNELRKNKDFTMLSIWASQKIRFERVSKRMREKDPQTFEEFLRIDHIEAYNPLPHAQKILLCMQMSDHIIVNEGSLEELNNNIDKLLHKLSEWNEQLWRKD